MSDWYETNIEEGVRDVVRLLRDNGINTQCSCHHEMYIQCDYPVDGQLKEIHDALFHHFTERGEPVSYEIEIIHKVEDGYTLLTCACVKLKRKPVQDTKSPVEGEVQ